MYFSLPSVKKMPFILRFARSSRIPSGTCDNIVDISPIIPFRSRVGLGGRNGIGVELELEFKFEFELIFFGGGGGGAGSASESSSREMGFVDVPSVRGCLVSTGGKCAVSG
jgi:hypothetical protein